MNYWKKMRKYITLCCVIGTIVIVIISVLFNKTKVQDEFIYFYNSYNLTSAINEDDYLNVNIYVNNTKSYFVDCNQISTCYIESDTGSVDLSKINIYNENQNIDYHSEKYYKFNFKFKLQYNTLNYNSWFITNAKLIIRYNNNAEYILKIGDISINKIENNEENISLSTIKPLTSIINKNTYLTGLILGIRKTCDYEVILKKIKLLDANLFVGNKVEVLSYLPETNKFEDVANYNYSSLNVGVEDVDFELSESTIYFFIPIYYNIKTISNKFPILLELSVNNNIKNYVFSNYTFYEPSEYIINEHEIVINKIK